MRGIGKSFFGVAVLHGVDLDLRGRRGPRGRRRERRRQVDADEGPRRRLPRPTGARCRIDGEAVGFSHPVQAQAAGVAIIYQEFNLLPERTVAENVFVGREPARHGLVDRRAMEQRTAELLEELGEVSFGPRSLVRRLSVAQQQMVEIVKALSLDARLLVMDEPTAALAEHEVEVLFALVRRLRERGLGVLYISHRLHEIFATLRPHHGAQGRRARRHAAGRRGRHRQAGLADGRPRARRLLPAARHAGGARRRPAAVRRASRRGCCATSSSRSAPARSSGSPASRAPAARSWRARSSASTRSRAGTVEVDGKRPVRRPPQRDPRRHRLPHRGPQGRGPRARAVGPRQHAARRCARSAAASAGGCRTRSSVQELAQSVELRARSLEQEVALPLGRQPAEGRARQVAGDEAGRPDLRRADARHRRRRQGRHPRPDARARARGRRDPDDLVRAARGDRHERPHPRDARRRDRRRAAGRRRRDARSCSWRRPTRWRPRERHDERARSPPPRRASRARARRSPTRPRRRCSARCSASSSSPGSSSRSTAAASSPSTTSSACSQRSVALGIVAVGQTLVILGGSLDLSVAYVISLSSLVAAEVMAGEEANLVPAIARGGRARRRDRARQRADHHQAARQRVHRHARHGADHQGLPRRPLRRAGGLGPGLVPVARLHALRRRSRSRCSCSPPSSRRLVPAALHPLRATTSTRSAATRRSRASPACARTARSSPRTSSALSAPR